MSRTYKAELTPWRMHPLHERYLDRTDRITKLPARERIQNPRYETTCPFCGERGLLVAKIRVGAKKLVEDVPLSERGYALANVRERTTQIQIIHCTGEHTHPQTGEEGIAAAIDPMAYLCPVVFVRDREQAQEIIDL